MTSHLLTNKDRKHLESIIKIEINNIIIDYIHHKAKEGYTFKRKVDNFIMGNEPYLGKFIDGTDDVIDNYEEMVDPDYNPTNSD